MAKVFFIDAKKIKVEASNGDVCILNFSSNLNYQINERDNGNFIKFLEFLFDNHYDGNLETVWKFNVPLMQRRFDPIFTYQLDRDKERERIGMRIKGLREERNMEAKMLASKVGIDPANLCRIEQGRYSVGFDILTKIATVLNCRIDFISEK